MSPEPPEEAFGTSNPHAGGERGEEVERRVVDILRARAGEATDEADEAVYAAAVKIFFSPKKTPASRREV